MPETKALYGTYQLLQLPPYAASNQSSFFLLELEEGIAGMGEVEVLHERWSHSKQYDKVM